MAEVVKAIGISNYSKEPVFQKKQQEAKAFLQKHGLPEVFSKKK